jgi:hypothetical protein
MAGEDGRMSTYLVELIFDFSVTKTVRIELPISLAILADTEFLDTESEVSTFVHVQTEIEAEDENELEETVERYGNFISRKSNDAFTSVGLADWTIRNVNGQLYSEVGEVRKP